MTAARAASPAPSLARHRRRPSSRVAGVIGPTPAADPSVRGNADAEFTLGRSASRRVRSGRSTRTRPARLVDRAAAVIERRSGRRLLDHDRRAVRHRGRGRRRRPMRSDRSSRTSARLVRRPGCTPSDRAALDDPKRQRADDPARGRRRCATACSRPGTRGIGWGGAPAAATRRRLHARAAPRRDRPRVRRQPRPTSTRPSIRWRTCSPPRAPTSVSRATGSARERSSSTPRAASRTRRSAQAIVDDIGDAIATGAAQHPAAVDRPAADATQAPGAGDVSPLGRRLLGQRSNDSEILELAQRHRDAGSNAETGQAAMTGVRAAGPGPTRPARTSRASSTRRSWL